MKVSVEDINATRKVVSVAVAADEVVRAEEALVGEFLSQARLPGFRPGKAPATLVRRRFGKEIREELNRKMTAEAYETGLKESGVQVHSLVNLEGDSFASGQEGLLKLTVDIVPEFELPDYRGIRMEIAPDSPTEAEIEAAIEDLRNQRADYKVVEREAREGDFARCSYRGTIEGEAVDTIAPDAPLYGEQRNTWEEVGSSDSPGVRAVVKGLEGMKVGEKKTVTMPFPEDFEVEPLRGKTAEYEIELEEVRERILPEIDEEFLKGIQAESLEDLRKRISENIQNQKRQMNASRQREQVQQALIQKVDFPLPESAVEVQSEQILRDFMQRSMQQGVPREEFENRREELQESAARAAVDRVKMQILLRRIAEKESITVEDDDFSSAIMQEAMMTRTQPEKLVKELRNDRARIQEIRDRILMSKTMEFLVGAGEVVEVKPADSPSPESATENT